MLCVTTYSVDGRVVVSYRGIVAAEVIFGANLIRDFAASVTDVFGGRSAAYEKVFEGARNAGLELISAKAEERGANAILGVRFDYQVLGEKNGMMMVAITGTAVELARSEEDRKREEKESLLYFVEVGGTEKGPFSISQIHVLADSGRLERYASVRAEGNQSKYTVAELLRRNG
jgi:uncharacterized protein YbjQ (UPF0145 family)